ncbi:hypothetical protein ABZY45_04995 [Streptomyces sp. NPDC006516]|uniref:hypothetical protein n=1 Tax=Streptomyces sp. NPDC006516 TaxID=3154309 RepID=UPI0033B3EA9A
MSVTAPPTVLRRRTGVAAGAVLLTLVATGCSGLGRTAVGPVSYTTEGEKVVTVHSPSVKGCHKMTPAGAHAIDNRTLIDIILYPTRDCSGRSTAYVSTTFSDANAARALPWRSYRFVH